MCTVRKRSEPPDVIVIVEAMGMSDHSLIQDDQTSQHAHLIKSKAEAASPMPGLDLHIKQSRSPIEIKPTSYQRGHVTSTKTFEPPYIILIACGDLDKYPLIRHQKQVLSTIGNKGSLAVLETTVSTRTARICSPDQGQLSKVQELTIQRAPMHQISTISMHHPYP